MAQDEIAKSSGLAGLNTSGRSKGERFVMHTRSKASAEDLILQEELVQVLPKVQRANAMSQELRKDTKFEIVLVAPQARGLKVYTGRQSYFTTLSPVGRYGDSRKSAQREGGHGVPVGQRQVHQSLLWHAGTVSELLGRLQGLGRAEGNCSSLYLFTPFSLQDHDPFYEPPDSEMFIGGVQVYLRSLAYMIESEEQMPITDFKGQEKGQLKVN